jgi:hypothetical protein
MNLSAQKFVCQLKTTWSESFTQYKSSDYTLSIAFKNGNFNMIATVTVQSDGTFLCVLDLSTASNKLFANGNYTYQAIIQDVDSNVVWIENGKVLFLPNISKGQEDKSYWAVILKSLQDAYARLSMRETKEVVLYDGTRVYYEDAEKLLVRINQAKMMLSKEQGNIQKTNNRYQAIFR